MEAWTLQRFYKARFLSQSLLPMVCPLRWSDGECFNHVFSCAPTLVRVCSNYFFLLASNRLSPTGSKIILFIYCVAPFWAQKPILLWFNAVKGLLHELWNGRNQFIPRFLSLLFVVFWFSLKVLSWCTLSESFKGYSIQDLNRSWKSFIVPFYGIVLL